MRKWVFSILMTLVVTTTWAQSGEKLIAISWYYPNNAYQTWLREIDPTLKFVNIYGLPNDSVDYYLEEADGYILTGGSDINPDLHHTVDSLMLCGNTNPRRDSLETLMVLKGLDSKTPLLGVCRGMQIMNVAMGGTLILDLPSQRGTTLHQQEVGDKIHTIVAEPATEFAHIVGTFPIEVRSNHHQAIDQLAEGFSIQATSPDGVAEVIYWHGSSHPFALGLQWHPERMELGNPCSGNVAKEFLQAVESSKSEE